MNKYTADVIVIGSGAGGGAAAWALSQGGLSVLLLEAGQEYNPATDYRLSSPTWEQTGFPVKTADRSSYRVAPLQPISPNWQHLRSWNHISGLMNKGTRRMGWLYSHVRGLGGSTLHFTGEAHRLGPTAMNMRTRFNVAADWPISYDELEPFYCTAERIVGVAGPNDDPLRPRSQPYPLPSHPFGYAGSKLAVGCRKLGLSWTPNPVAILSKPYDGRPGCNYCNNCNRGCPRTDKGSVDVTFLRKARQTGRCQIKTGCTVVRIETNAADRVNGIVYTNHKLEQQRVTARAVIVAGGAVQTPRLLLLSANRYAPDGLANESGMVGMNFMETLHWTSSGIFPDVLGSQRGLPSDGICWDYNRPDTIQDVIGGCRFTMATAEADLIGPINYATRVVEGFGKQHKRAMRNIYGRVLSVGAIGESLPNPGSYIDLAAETKDEFGLPLPQIHSRLDDMELKRLEFMANKSREILQASGVKKIFEEYGSYDVFSTTHVFGTCRMGNDPDLSVVNRYCQSHRWNNLFIVDGSVFPSSGGGESPSLTIEALAIRTASRIRDLVVRHEI